MITLDSLENISRFRKNSKRVGRGVGSGKGKTCGRGEKGAGSRSGYKRRLGYEGGQMRLHMKSPTRGFSNVRFRKAYHIVNLQQIEQAYEEGEVVNIESLRERGFISGATYGVKILGKGELTKKVKFEVDAVSEGVKEKLQQLGAELSLIS